MKIKQITTNEYPFKQQDIFVFTTNVGNYQSGDFILLSHKTNNENEWKVITNCVALEDTTAVYASEVWLVNLLNSGEIIYIEC